MESDKFGSLQQVVDIRDCSLYRSVDAAGKLARSAHSDRHNDLSVDIFAIDVFDAPIQHTYSQQNKVLIRFSLV